MQINKTEKIFLKFGQKAGAHVKDQIESFASLQSFPFDDFRNLKWNSFINFYKIAEILESPYKSFLLNIVNFASIFRL